MRCRLRVIRDGTVLHAEHGEALFTEDGISGICAMECAPWLEKGGLLEADLTDGFFADLSDLKQELLFRRKSFGDQLAEMLLTGIVMPKISFAVCKQAGLSLRGERIESLTEEQLEKIAYVLTHYRFPVRQLRGLEDAQVTAGGAVCQEFYPETLASRRMQGLHAVGEVLDINGGCGGFNLMFAFGSGILAGRNGRTINGSRT